MKEINKIKVSYNGKVVGSIIRYQRYLTAFAYDPEWLSNGFFISPFSLPLREEPFIAKQEPFDGLFGVFADSLPDGWGRLLLDRLLLKNKINPHSVGNLERLAIVGASGMGALSYEPEYNISEKSGFADLDKLAEECSLILSSEYNDNIDELFSLGGSSGGARPKILTEVDGEDWIIKFPASMDKPDIGLQEYKYSLCARKCGISMSETHLFPSARCEIGRAALRIAASMVEVLIKWDVQETYILRYLLHCHEESESYTTSKSRCLDSGLEKLIREPQSAQNTIPARRCEYVPLGSFFGFLLRSLCALSHVSWSMIAS